MTSRFDPDNMDAGVVLPVPGRYTFKDAKFINDFDYAGTQDKQTAAQFVMVDSNGTEYELNITVSKPDKLWPSANGRELDPKTASIHKSSNFAHFMDSAINVAGLPKSRLTDDIFATFGGLTADFDGFVPPNRTKPLSVPVKFYLDGQIPAQAPAPTQSAPPVQATTAPPPAPPAPPAPATATPPVDTPAPPPQAPRIPPVQFEPPPQAPTTGELDMDAKGLDLAKNVLANPEMPNQRQAVNQLVIQDQSLNDEQRMAMMTHVFSDPFWAYLQANGVTLDG